MFSIADNIKTVSQRIQNATKSAARPADSVTLLAVSKTKPADVVRAAYDAGLRDFGENYLQEAQDKIAQLSDLSITWHFIGPLQSNKTRLVAELFQWVHTVDREKIARRLSEQRPEGTPPLNVCIQVNINDESSKSGVSPDEVASLADTISALPGLRLRGLMCIPDPTQDEEALAATFKELSRHFAALQSRFDSVDTLSMGMSDDMEAAIAAGSTIVRIGSAIFGARNY
ncbi:YggS family pyridoxal phosphate-dependent enzyme [Hahella sp. KA22]|uniref:YggS family pyridoxal phosphate-dependent enzyme n=1 Tax=Hahella sp. KA22 TaxID=1628392 RepID=UPI000FDEDA04|nr:YggS family pyridoxal phosphate-dependent enzyme [Hahella sp. KA22]AZZ94802.1 YggS family pyridoxal phosphate-dependent enzyme [Hahella sp. KA22]QAY58176.1 YggS family pyridoxal phosphate-dependent enzyme [Hahella sp. KA22]